MSRKVYSNYMSKKMTNIGDTAEAITHCSGCSCIRRIYKIHLSYLLHHGLASLLKQNKTF